MVHALQKIHSWLAPAGTLIDIHPRPDLPPIEVHLADQIFLAGWLRETDERIEYSQADQALATVIQNGLFALAEGHIFTFAIKASHLPELQTFLADNWKDALLDEALSGRIAQLLQTIEPNKAILIREQIGITRLLKLPVALI